MRWRKNGKWQMFIEVSRGMFHWFCVAMTALVLGNGLISRISSSEWMLYDRDLCLFLLTASLAVLPFLMFVFIDRHTQAVENTFRAIHFTLTAVFVVGPLTLLGVTGRNITLPMVIIIFALFAAIYWGGYFRDMSVAKKINAKLDALHNEENATDED